MKDLPKLELVGIGGVIATALLWYFVFPYSFWPLIVIGLFIMLLVGSSKKRRKSEVMIAKVDQGGR